VLSERDRSAWRAAELSDVLLPTLLRVRGIIWQTSVWGKQAQRGKRIPAIFTPRTSATVSPMWAGRI
jgi:hypothetical protein